MKLLPASTSSKSSRLSQKALLVFGLLLMTSFIAHAAYLQPRIMGGEDVTPGDFEWAAVLQFEDDPEFTDSRTGAGACTGAHIGEGWILTANHCVNFEIRVGEDEYQEYTRKLDKITVKIGDNHTEVSGDPARHFDVEEIVSHPENPYIPPLNQHDIALLRLDTTSGDPTVLEPTVRPASPMLDSQLTAHNDEGTAIGWGLQGFFPSDTDSPALQRIDMYMVDNNQCHDLYGSMEWHDHYLCFGFLASEGFSPEELYYGGRSGDSGGPVLALDEDGEWVHLGVFSFRTFVNNQLPGVYMRTAHHLDWINDVTGLDFDTTPAPSSSSDNGSSDSSGAINPLLLLALLGMVAVRFRRGTTISADHK